MVAKSRERESWRATLTKNPDSNPVMSPFLSCVRIPSCLVVACMALSSPAFAAGEPYRPAFHFTPERNWLNDPNGLVYYKGEYHMFFQYNPFGIGGANKSWGHAVSSDLVHWKELPVAIPVANGIEIFSGSAVIDWNNTSGFQNGAEPPMVAIYTGHGAVQDQRVAYSNDRGRTFTNFSGNPVIPSTSNDFRDPNVFWHQPTSRWVMAVCLPGQRKVRFYNSTDLKSWTQTSEFGPAGSTSGIWECPSFYMLPVDGEATKKWVLTVSCGGGAPSGGTGSQYFVGEFDGSTFTSDASAPPPPLPNGTLIADFEGSGFGGWSVTGTAFGSGPVAGALPQQQPVSGYRGSKLVNSYHGTDSTTGTLTSPPFHITADYISFLIGGGNHPGQTCINLLVGGNVVRTATGQDDERLNWKNWDVSEFIGMNGTLQIVDAATGGWGHVNVDHILMADEFVAPEPGGNLWMDYGPDNYAPITWNDIPASDGRTLWIGWMVDLRYLNVPTTPWRGGMTLPRELILKRTTQGLRMSQRPVKELESLRRRHLSAPVGNSATVDSWLASQDIPKLMECVVELEVPEGESAGLKIGNSTQFTTVTWDRSNSTVKVDRTQSGRVDFHSSFPGVYSAPVQTAGNRLKIHFLVDHGSVEVFAADGTAALTTLIFPDASTKGLRMTGSPSAQVVSLDVWELASAQPATKTGLLGHWKFDETSPGSHADSSGHGNAMALQRGSPAPLMVQGRAGNGLEIRRQLANNGLTSLLVPAAEPLMPDSFSVSFHFNPKTNDNAKLALIRWETPAGLAWGTEILNNRRMNFYVFDSDSANDVQSAAALPFEAFDASGGTADNIDNDPAWHHVAASYDSVTGKLTLYLDGVKSEKTVTSLLGAPRYGSLGIGGGLRTGDGLMIYDDLRIYQGVLSDTEVNYLRQNPGVNLPPPVVGTPVPPEISISLHGSSAFVNWPSGTGLALWKSTTLDSDGWSKVPGSEYTTSHGSVISAEPVQFFRLSAP